MLWQEELTYNMHLRNSIRWLSYFLLFVLSGCDKSVPLTLRDVAGVYIVKYSHGTETLDLRADGTFAQRYVDKAQGIAVENQGTWNLDAASEQVDLLNVL